MNVHRCLALACLSALAACSTNSASFVERHPMSSVVKGRLVRVDGLSSDAVTRLADGVAFAVAPPGCKVTLEFPDGSVKVMTLRPDAVVVAGGDGCFILRAVDAEEEAVERTTTTPPAAAEKNAGPAAPGPLSPRRQSERG